MSEIRRILIVRALKLGDLLCTVPALRTLRAAHPFAEIRLVGLPWSTELVQRFDTYLDGLFVLPGFPGFPEAPFEPQAFVRFLAQVQDWAPDLVLQLHGSGDLSNPLAVLLGGRQTAGFYVPGQYCPDGERFIPYPHDLPEVSRHLRVLEHLGMPPQGTHRGSPIHDADRRALAATLAEMTDAAPLSAGRYAVVHPGASVPERRWPPERFAAVADDLTGRGLSIVLTGSTIEADTTGAVREEVREPCIDLTGRTTLGTLAALLADAALLVSNDTGVMHVAEGTRTPLVAVSFDPESWRWAPVDEARHRVLTCGHAVRTEDVLEVAMDLLCSRPGVCQTVVSGPGQTPDAEVSGHSRR